MSFNLFLKFILVLTAGLLGAILAVVVIFATHPLYASLYPMGVEELIPFAIGVSIVGLLGGILGGVRLIRKMPKGS